MPPLPSTLYHHHHSSNWFKLKIYSFSRGNIENTMSFYRFITFTILFSEQEHLIYHNLLFFLSFQIETSTIEDAGHIESI